MKQHREFFIIHSNLDKKCVLVNNDLLIIITVFLLFLFMLNK